MNREKSTTRRFIPVEEVEGIPQLGGPRPEVLALQAQLEEAQLEIASLRADLTSQRAEVSEVRESVRTQRDEIAALREARSSLSREGRDV